MSCCSAARQTSSRTPIKSFCRQCRPTCPETHAWAGWLTAMTPSASFRSNMNHLNTLFSLVESLWQSLHDPKPLSLQPLAERSNVLCIACFDDTMHGHGGNVVVRKRTVVG